MSFTICLKFRDCRAALGWILLQHETGTKFKKLVHGKRISILNVPIGKTGLPFQNFRLPREFSSGTNQKNVYHLHPNRNLREFVVNGKQPKILDSTLWIRIPGTGFLIPCQWILWIPDSNRWRNSGFLKLDSGFQFPGIRIPQAMISRIQNPYYLIWGENGFLRPILQTSSASLSIPCIDWKPSATETLNH